MRAKLIALVTAGLLVGTSSIAQAHGDDADDRGNKQQLAQLRKATAPYRRISNAFADGYTAFAIPPSVGGTSTAGLGLPGDPTCFDDPAGGMGVHYVKDIDAIVDPIDPEALVYEVGEHGRLNLVGVEYIVPETLVDPNNIPMLFGEMFHHHPYLPVFILHAWVWKHNPSGLFADWNPRVGACPAPIP